LIYLITVNYYSGELIANLLDSIRSQCSAQVSCQLVIVNNSIADQSLDHLLEINQQASSQNPPVKLINSPENIGFGRACNLALTWVYIQDPQAIVWLINPDAYLSDGAIDQLQELLQEHDHLSIIGTTVYDQHQRTYFTGGTFSPRTGVIKEQLEPQPNPDQAINTKIDWVSGCSLIINLAMFTTCPQFDPDYFLYYEDFDFCRRYLKQGHKMAIAHQIQVIHQTSALTSQNPGFKRKHEIYSYLLSLSKHASPIAFAYRYVRILLVSLLQLGFKPRVAIAKLQGIYLCTRNLIQQSNRERQKSAIAT
jgi:N-acetylglucosaminyl-diphospho-decaprenol L-rhamnosyltransferase